MYKILLQHPKSSLLIGILAPLLPLLIMIVVLAQAFYLLSIQVTAPTASTSDPQVKAVKDVFTLLSSPSN